MSSLKFRSRVAGTWTMKLIFGQGPGNAKNVSNCHQLAVKNCGQMPNTPRIHHCDNHWNRNEKGKIVAIGTLVFDLVSDNCINGKGSWLHQRMVAVCWSGVFPALGGTTWHRRQINGTCVAIGNGGLLFGMKRQDMCAAISFIWVRVGPWALSAPLHQRDPRTFMQRKHANAKKTPAQKLPAT